MSGSWVLWGLTCCCCRRWLAAVVVRLQQWQCVPLVVRPSRVATDARTSPITSSLTRAPDPSLAPTAPTGPPRRHTSSAIWSADMAACRLTSWGRVPPPPGWAGTWILPWLHTLGQGQVCWLPKLCVWRESWWTSIICPMCWPQTVALMPPYFYRQPTHHIRVY